MSRLPVPSVNWKDATEPKGSRTANSLISISTIVGTETSRAPRMEAHGETINRIDWERPVAVASPDDHGFFKHPSQVVRTGRAR